MERLLTEFKQEKWKNRSENGTQVRYKGKKKTL